MDEWESCRVVMKQHLAVRPGEKEHIAGHSPSEVQSLGRVKWPSAVLSDQSVPGLPAPQQTWSWRYPALSPLRRPVTVREQLARYSCLD